MHRFVALGLSLLLFLLTGAEAVSIPATPAAASLAEPRFDTVSPAGSTPGIVMAALVQDKQGFLWVGTGAGLMRYDGYGFRVQRRTDGKSLGFVRVLLAGRDGRVWIGTEADGLAVYDPANEAITVHSNKVAGRPARAGTVRALAEDRDGAIWIGTLGGGLDRFDPVTGQFTTFRHDDGKPGSLPDNRVQALRVDSEGALWVGSWAGLHRKKPGSDVFEPVLSAPGEPLAGHSVLSLHQAEDGQVWAGTQQGDLLLADPVTGAARMLTPQGGNGAVTTFADVPGAVWVGGLGGIEVRAADGSLIRHLRRSLRYTGGLVSNEVRTLMRDRAGWIWLASYGGVLQRHDPINRSIWVRGASEGHGEVLAEPNVRSVGPVSRGAQAAPEIWLGMAEHGVAILDAQLRLIGSVSGMPPSRVDAIAQTADGHVWLGTDTGLLQVDAAQRKLIRAEKTAPGGVRRLLAASSGRLWIGTRAGLLYREAGGSEFRPMHAESGRPLAGDINAIVEGKDQSLWIGGEMGLYHLPQGGTQLQRVITQAGHDSAETSVVGLLVDSQQRLWVDTSLGLQRMSSWDGKTASFERVSEKLGIGERAFGANLQEDKQGRIWTQHYVYNPQSGSVYELTAADGVDFGSAWFRSYAALDDGRMLFGGSRGLLVVQPEQFKGWRFDPPVVISELLIDGKPQEGFSAQGQGLPTLQLQAGQRSFSVEFAALDYSDPARNRYAYQLQGFDADWQSTGSSNRHASYSNLGPGKYTLKVKGSNRTGAWSPHELSLAVEVLPNWWQTWWFRAIEVLLLAFAFWGIVQLRTGVLRRRQLALQAEVGRRTAELQSLSESLRLKTIELEASSLTDPLTGLRNRRFLTQHIDADVALTQRHFEDALQRGEALPTDADLIFFLLDIDYFKFVNDEHGHASGDAVLRQMRSRLQPVFREVDYLVRWGGEEFLIVARGCAREHAAELAERARAFVADQPFLLEDGKEKQLTCSVGFACFPLVATQPRALDWNVTIALADDALYTVKHSGRDGWLGVLTAQPQADLATVLRGARQALALDAQDTGSLQLVRSAPHATASGH